MSIILLKRVDDTDCLINTDKIILVAKEDDKASCYKLALQDSHWILIKETPKEVLAKMKELQEVGK